MNFAVQHVIINILENPPVYKHFSECEHFNYVVNLHSLLPSNNSGKYLEHVKFAVHDTTKIINICQNWVQLFFKKPSHQMEETKTGLLTKVTKELAFFISLTF